MNPESLGAFPSVQMTNKASVARVFVTLTRLNALILTVSAALTPTKPLAGLEPPDPRVNAVENGESKVTPDECRGMIVGPGVNQPDPFPGYGGSVGWESPVRLQNGDWLVGFNAGYWHASVSTPMHYTAANLEAFRKMGMPTDIVAPTGGRAMITRSRDEGKPGASP